MIWKILKVSSCEAVMPVRVVLLVTPLFDNDTQIKRSLSEVLSSTSRIFRVDAAVSSVSFKGGRL